MHPRSAEDHVHVPTIMIRIFQQVRRKIVTIHLVRCHAHTSTLPFLHKIRRHEAYLAQIRTERRLEREEWERHLRNHRHLVWRNRTAVRLLGTSVNDIFLFFAQRVANLAGSRRTHNDALRDNGEGVVAVLLTSEICTSTQLMYDRKRCFGLVGVVSCVHRTYFACREIKLFVIHTDSSTYVLVRFICSACGVAGIFHRLTCDTIHVHGGQERWDVPTL